MKSNLYTRTGDSGTTSLVGGQRVRKDSLRLEAYGTLDEFSAFLGVVLSSKDCPDAEKSQLLNIQNRLFDLGGYLATLPPPDNRPLLPGMDSAISEVETWIDSLDETTPKARAFVLPGGTEISAHAHVARTVCRRAERAILRLAAEEWVDPRIIQYVNRLSDYLFILARYLNFRAGIEEIKWKPNKL
ncbi:MAG: cob(I)yrinic acid a,c-diamide adenosyltransferase [Muribaculaceae bacterium]|nr:cob(I)yrinic acid a,c-diamide adenosyltransferase [Muribaculaceae bacterium]